MIKMNNITKAYNSKIILDSLDLNLFDNNKIYAIVGESGVGKTTLLNILFGLEYDFDGRYELFGTNVSLLSKEKWSELRRNDIRIVFQDYKLIDHLTVLETLKFSGDYDDNYIKLHLRQVGLEDVVNQKVSLLSGGQKQRLALVRASICTPKILLLDEPTGNLDSETTEIIKTYLSHLKESGTLILIVTHDANLIDWVDTVYELRNKFLYQIKDSIQPKEEGEHNIREITSKSPSIIKIFYYIILTLRRKWKKVLLQIVPLFIILASFILLFIGYRSYSLNNFTEFFSGIDDKTIVFNTTDLKDEKREELNNRGIDSSYVDNRMGFSKEDLENIKKINNLKQVTLGRVGILKHLDYENHLLNLQLDRDILIKNSTVIGANIHSIRSITFQFTQLPHPANFIKHYNRLKINLLQGNLPKDNSNEVLLPEFLWEILKRTSSSQYLIGEEIELNTISSAEGKNFKKKYIISGIYSTNFSEFVDPEYSIITGYSEEFDLSKNYNAESLKNFKILLTGNEESAKYHSRILQDEISLRKAIGLGKDEMIIVMESEKSVPDAIKQINQLYPHYELVSQYSLKHGKFADIYSSMNKILIIGSIIIALLIGISVTFINKNYIYNRNFELATLYTLGYPIKSLSSIIFIENTITFSVSLLTAYVLSGGINTFFLSQTRVYALYKDIFSMDNIISLTLLVFLIMTISSIWSLIGIRPKKIKKILNGS